MTYCFVATASHSINLGEMPDAALLAISKHFAIQKTSRDDQITAIRDLLHEQTYESLEPIVRTLREIAIHHGCGELVLSLDSANPS